MPLGAVDERAAAVAAGEGPLQGVDLQHAAPHQPPVVQGLLALGGGLGGGLGDGVGAQGRRGGVGPLQQAVVLVVPVDGHLVVRRHGAPWGDVSVDTVWVSAGGYLMPYCLYYTLSYICM